MYKLEKSKWIDGELIRQGKPVMGEPRELAERVAEIARRYNPDCQIDMYELQNKQWVLVKTLEKIREVRR